PPHRSTVHGTGVLAGDSRAATTPPAATHPAPGGPRPTRPRANPAGITMAFAGDVHFAGRTAGRATLGAGVLGPIGRTMAAADVGMVNLESAITERGTAEPKEFHFRAPPVVLDSLRRAGVDVLTLANNHAVDYGPGGLADTLAAVGSHPPPVVGIGAAAGGVYARGCAPASGPGVGRPAASQFPAGTVAAGPAGQASPGIASAGSARLVAAVRAARRQAAVVVVYLHWGTEGQDCPN